MIIVLKANRSEEQVKNFISNLTDRYDVSVNTWVGTHSTVLGLIGDTAAVDSEYIAAQDIVESVKRVQEPYKKANRKFHPEDTVIKLPTSQVIGDGSLALIAGPCSVESEAQICCVAERVKAAGATFLRGGAFKPRTSPYSFQGMRSEGLDLLKLRPYQKALVIGDGFMGQIFAQLLQAYGVHQVDLAGIFDEKLQRNKEQFGVTETYNTTREQIPADSYDVIVEAVGLPTTQAQAVAAAKKGAQVLMFGVGPQEAHFEMNTYDIYKKQLTIQGSFINPLTFRDAISLVSSGKMNIGGLISHELELEQVQDFLDGKITGVSKAVVKVGK